jgi:hypothetical protein
MMYLSPRLRFAVLQAVVFVVGAGGPYVSFPLTIFVVWPGTTVAGIVLAVKGFSRGNRAGIRDNRFVGALLLTLAGSVISWLIVLVVLGNIMHIALLAFGLALIWVPALGVFSAGSLAYLGLGPFRSRLSAMARVRQILDGDSDARIGVRATPGQLAEAERILGHRLPLSFREFLSTWGEIEIGSTKFLGIPLAMEMAHPTPADFVGATLDGRDKLGLPRPFVLCASYPNGLHVCLDTFSMRNEEGPAVLWNGVSRVLVQILAPTFADFLRDQMEAALKSVPSTPIPGNVPLML